MYNLDFSNFKRQIKFYSIFLLGGLFFLMCSVITTIIIPITKSNKYEGRVEAFDVEIVDVSKVSDKNRSRIIRVPVFHYRVDNQTYKCMSDTSAKSIKDVGDSKTVYYDINEPTKCISDYDKDILFKEITALILPSLLIYAGVFFINRSFKKLNRIKKLSKHGKLVKGLKYKLVESGTEINGRKIPCIQVDYEISLGRIITLKSEPKFSNMINNEDGLVDLLIDPMDETNYYIDFEIK